MATPAVWVVRHGETEWSRDGLHTSRTELSLTEKGRAQASSLRRFFSCEAPELVLCSPRLRARETAELAGLSPFSVCEDLAEWEYGELEGLTTSEIRSDFPGWSIWDGPWPGGETASQVAERADRVVSRLLDAGAPVVAVVGHGHFSRVLAARWVESDASTGRRLDLDTGTVSQLGWAREDRVVRRWNAPVAS